MLIMLPLIFLVLKMEIVLLETICLATLISFSLLVMLMQGSLLYSGSWRTVLKTVTRLWKGEES